jgi:hypothetical protein
LTSTEHEDTFDEDIKKEEFPDLLKTNNWSLQQNQLAINVKRGFWYIFKTALTSHPANANSKF